MASDSSTSTTPALLTPDSTGGGMSLPVDQSVKKARRQTAFYPNMNASNKPQKPFSRSAAKRESVMALGSIEHLQHYFTKTGIAAKQSNLDKPRAGLVPAIGGLANISVVDTDAPPMQLPPSPAIPNVPRLTFPPSQKPAEIDPESLLPGVIRDLQAVVEAWSIGPPSSSPNLTAAESSAEVDVLNLLQITTQTIRSSRNYVLSLPDESAGTIRAQFRARTLGPGRIRPTPNRPAASSSQPDPLTLIRRSALEVLSVLRELEERARVPLSDEAYDAQSDGGGGSLGTDPAPSRVASPVALATDDDDGHPHVGDTSVTFSLVQVQGRYESVPVWEDEEDLSLFPEEDVAEKKERWDERLVLGGGWLYKPDITMGELEKERTAVRAYVDVVDNVLFEGEKEGSNERGWERRAAKKIRSRSKGRRRVSAGDGDSGGRGGMTRSLLSSDDIGGGRRRVSTGMVDALGGLSLTEEGEEASEGDANEGTPQPQHLGQIAESPEPDDPEAFAPEELEDEDLPSWARRKEFVGDNLGRARAMLLSSLPSTLHYALGSASLSRADLLNVLSSGQLLCIAYNTRVRKSRQPWGYIDHNAIHDILELERAGEGGSGMKKGWTFRRTDNLILWAGALKLRYLLPIHIPPAHSRHSNAHKPLPAIPKPSSTSSTPSHPPVAPLTFDPKLIARKEEGWENMLEAVLDRWIEAIVEERRNNVEWMRE
ncbi:hypothetical protein PTI98_013241 [Pleurotus ostreatus]|nr:hypothetical protein PTI98_013241 [Pleurotus ostreatus]